MSKNAISPTAAAARDSARRKDDKFGVQHRAELDLTPDPDAGLTREVDEHGTVHYRNSDDLLHREDGPACERPDGTREWYLNGLPHREDGPAYEGSNGTRFWYLNGKLHREDGPAVEWADSSRSWYLNGKLHREDGPAVEGTDGTRAWYRDGALHREDGPAVEWEDGTREWYLDGERLSEAEFEVRKPAAHQGQA